MSEFSWPEPPQSPAPSSGRIRRMLKRARAYIWPAGNRFLQQEEENNRLRLLLEQSPQAYAAWSESGQSAIAPHLARWLRTGDIHTIDDLLQALTTEDAEALESLWQRLQREGQPFSLRARTADEERTLGIQAERRTTESGDHLAILWFSDLTHSMSNVTRIQREKIQAEHAAESMSLRLNTLPLPLWLRQKDGQLLWVNHAYSAMIESDTDTAIANQKELMGSKSGIAMAIAQRARNEREIITEKHPLIIQGERRLTQISEMPIGQDGQTLGMAQDMSELEEMQSELRRFRASNQELLRALNTGIAIFNPKTQLTFYNDAFLALFPLDEFFLDDKPSLGEVMEALREKRRLPEQADFRLYKKQWMDRFTSLIAQHEELMHLPDGTAIRMVVVPHPLGGLFMTFEDVTSRLELESSYNTLIAVQRETLDNLAEGLAVWRSDARLALFNPAYARLWGLNAKDLETTPHASEITPQLENLFDAEQWQQAHDILQQASISRKESNGRLILQDGRVVEYAAIPLPDGGMLNRFNDISDTLKVEMALREKNAALEQAERLKQEFLANVSYQLRTPLNAMMGFAEVLEKQYFGPLNERQMEYAIGMTQAGEKLISLINDILDLSTIDAGFLALQIRPLDIYPMMQSLYDITSEWARREHIDMTMDCPKTIGSIPADERRLKQVLLNLISNSIKFTPEGGKIELKVERLDHDIAFHVIDTGVGISQEDQEKIFSPFVQLQNTHRHGGAGLGLSLVKSILELHDGRIHMQSEPGKGTHITCYLPITARSDAA